MQGQVVLLQVRRGLLLLDVMLVQVLRPEVVKEVLVVPLFSLSNPHPDHTPTNKACSAYLGLRR